MRKVPGSTTSKLVPSGATSMLSDPDMSSKACLLAAHIPQAGLGTKTLCARYIHDRPRSAGSHTGEDSFHDKKRAIEVGLHLIVCRRVTGIFNSTQDRVARIIDQVVDLPED